MEEYDRLEHMYLVKYRINEKSLLRMDLKSMAQEDDTVAVFKCAKIIYL